MKNEVHIVINLDRYPILSDYYSTFRTKSYGVQIAAEIYPMLRQHALQSIKGVFTLNEIKLLLKILDSESDKFVISKSMFIQKIQNIIDLQPTLTDEQKNTNRQIIQKIEELDFYQAIVFSEWLATYRSFSEKYSKKKISLKKYAESLLS